MKQLLLLLTFVLLNRFANAQFNLVPNPSFEDTLNCPTGLDNMQEVQHWSSFGNSADYFNGCSLTMNVPNTPFGYQLSHSGTAFSGVITYLRANHPNGNNYREFIGAQLLSPLQIGTRYYFSFYAVSAQNNSIGFFSNNIGLRFFTNSYDRFNPAPMDNFSHIKLDTLLKDTVNWLKISGSFIADSNYQFVCIGNFYDYLNTDTLAYILYPQCAYSYIDDVCVTIDSLYNQTWTGLHDFENNALNIWPNPVKDYFQFRGNQSIDEINIFDCRGKLIKSELVNSIEGRINLSEIKQGVYSVSFRKEKAISVLKLIKL